MGGFTDEIRGDRQLLCNTLIIETQAFKDFSAKDTTPEWCECHKQCYEDTNTFV